MEGESESECGRAGAQSAESLEKLVQDGDWWARQRDRVIEHQRTLPVRWAARAGPDALCLGGQCAHAGAAPAEEHSAPRSLHVRRRAEGPRGRAAGRHGRNGAGARRRATSSSWLTAGAHSS